MLITEENKMSRGWLPLGLYKPDIHQRGDKNHKSKTLRIHRFNSKGCNARNYQPVSWYNWSDDRLYFRYYWSLDECIT